MSNFLEDLAKSFVETGKKEITKALNKKGGIGIYCLRCEARAGDISKDEKDIVQFSCECGTTVQCAIKENRLYVEVS